MDKENAKWQCILLLIIHYMNIHLQSDFHSELEALKQQLDERYRLCRSCHKIVKHHLNVQAMDLKTFLLGSHLQQSKSTPTKVMYWSFYCLTIISLIITWLVGNVKLLFFTCYFVCLLIYYYNRINVDDNLFPGKLTSSTACTVYIEFWLKCRVVTTSQLLVKNHYLLHDLG